MAGKKCMVHRRPRTQAERDVYALTKIEQYIDSHILRCDKCKAEMRLQDISPTVASLLNKRYDKLRPSLSQTSVTATVTSFVDVLDRIAAQQVGNTDIAIDAEQRNIH